MGEWGVRIWHINGGVLPSSERQNFILRFSNAFIGKMNGKSRMKHAALQ